MPVQSWVKKHDGKFGALVLLVCDEPVLYSLPVTKRSLLIYGDGILQVGLDVDVTGKGHHFTVKHPTYGEIDDYTVADATKTLLTA